jgi:hypothetical protein
MEEKDWCQVAGWLDVPSSLPFPQEGEGGGEVVVVEAQLGNNSTPERALQYIEAALVHWLTAALEIIKHLIKRIILLFS